LWGALQIAGTFAFGQQAIRNDFEKIIFHWSADPGITSQITKIGTLSG